MEKPAALVGDTGLRRKEQLVHNRPISVHWLKYLFLATKDLKFSLIYIQAMTLKHQEKVHHGTSFASSEFGYMPQLYSRDFGLDLEKDGESEKGFQACTTLLTSLVLDTRHREVGLEVGRPARGGRVQ